MFAITLLVLALSALSSAHPTWKKRDTTCTAPSTFMILQFGVFTPSAGNTHAPNLAFTFGDENYETLCNSNVTSNPTTPIQCANSNIEYLWDGANTLTIGETYTPCNSTATAFTAGSLFISLDCIPSEYPFGDGTLCEDPIGGLGGEFTRSTLSP